MGLNGDVTEKIAQAERLGTMEWVTQEVKNNPGVRFSES